MKPCSNPTCDGTRHYTEGAYGKTYTTCPLERAKIVFKRSGLPLWTFDILDKKVNNAGKNIKSIEDFLSSQYNTLILTGNVGVGKTHLGIATLFESAAKGLNVKYVEDKSFVKMCADIYNDDKETQMKARRDLATLEKAYILLYDDFGLKIYSEHVLTQFKHLLDTFNWQNKKLILTTNYSIEELMKRLTVRTSVVWAARILSRLEQDSMIINIKGEDCRKRRGIKS